MTRIRRKYTEAELGLRRMSPEAKDIASKQREQRRGKKDAVARLLKHGVDPALLGPDFFPERTSKKKSMKRHAQGSQRATRKRRH